MLNVIGIEIQKTGGGLGVGPFIDSPYVDPEGDYIDETSQEYVQRSIFDSIFILPPTL